MFEPLLRITFCYSASLIVAATLDDIDPSLGLWSGFACAMGVFLWENLQ